MPIFALLLGILFVDAGIRNNAKDVFGQLATDAQGFLAFGAAIMILAIMGASSTLRPISKSLLFLLFTVFLLKNGNAVVKGLTASASAMPASSTSSTPQSNVSESNAQANQNASDAVNAFAEIEPFIEALG